MNIAPYEFALAISRELLSLSFRTLSAAWIFGKRSFFDTACDVRKKTKIRLMLRSCFAFIRVSIFDWDGTIYYQMKDKLIIVVIGP